jgi:hypothetical protein
MTAKMREKRILQLKYEYEQQNKLKTIYKYELMTNEKKLMTITTTVERVVVHFAHKDFKRCRIFDQHLEVC